MHPFPHTLRIVIASLLALMFASLASAAPLEDALRRFAADSYSETETAIRDIALSGSPQAQAILEALQAGRLSTAGELVIVKTPDGTLLNAATGTAVPLAPADMAMVRINNKLRRALETALGSLTLMSADPARRMTAAESIFKSREASGRDALVTALAAEKDAKIRKTMEEALAVLTLSASAPPAVDALNAIKTLRERGDQDALSALRAALPNLKDAGPKSAADTAVADIESRLKIANVFQNIWYGLSLGSVLLLAAIGLSITFGVMGVINMAHGEMVMLGAYATFLTQEAFKAYAPSWFGWSLAAAIPIAFLTAAAVGVLIERGIIRFLYGRPLETLLATFGVSLILQQAVRTLFGPTNREVSAPSFMSGAFDLFGLSIAWGRLSIIIFTLAVFAGLLFLLKATPLGLQMRAVTQNRRMASSMGIRTAFVDSATFALGSGIAGVAGVALSQIDNVSPNLGQSYIIDSFMVVVFGGVGNLWGTLVSAFALGIGNKFLEPLAGAVLAKIAILVCLILFIQKRPSGLFALKGRAVEA